MTKQKAIEWIRAISATQTESIHKNSLQERKEALHMAIEGLEKGVALIEEMAEELENCYGRETELTRRARDFLNDD